MNDRQRAFVRHYLANGGNASQAYVSAGYSPKCADRHGPRLARNGAIASAIAKGQARAEKRTEITLDGIIRDLHTEAHDHGEGTTQAARVRALELLGRHLGLRQKVEHELSGAVTLQQAVDTAAAALAEGSE